jgi:hypothetical protein
MVFGVCCVVVDGLENKLINSFSDFWPCKARGLDSLNLSAHFVKIGQRQLDCYLFGLHAVGPHQVGAPLRFCFQFVAQFVAHERTIAPAPFVCK